MVLNENDYKEKYLYIYNRKCCTFYTVLDILFASYMYDEIMIFSFLFIL